MKKQQIEANPDTRIINVKSPLVGIFRCTENGSSPFVQIGDAVEKQTVLCAIEVLGVVYHLKAFTRGTVHQIGPRDGEPVEYGETLFQIVREDAA